MTPEPSQRAFEHDVIGGTLGTIFAVVIVVGLLAVAVLLALAIYWGAD